MSNGNTGNVPLQLRGGKNYEAFAGIISGYGTDVFMVPSTELIVLEGTDDLKVGDLGGDLIGALLGGGGGFITLENNTGGLISAALYLVDKYGGEIELDTVTDLADGDSESLGGADLSSLFFLAKRDKYVLRITAGNPTAGSGIRASRGMVRLSPALFERLGVNEKVTQPIFRYKGEPGAAAIIALYNLFNVSSSDVNNVYVRVSANGQVVAEDNLGPLAAGEGSSYPLIGIGNIETEIEFDALPGDGYLYGAVARIIPTNFVPIQPPING